ncbi:site-specific integrase [Microbulbifer thermotolerans]|uniref:site-specific integrase n=1 Tax=Microbulbifer thermotolerans TaxID=252514 RepID=UPI00396A912C
MDRFRAFMRSRYLAYRTEKTYCFWVRDFIRFHQMRRPEDMGAAEVDAWLGHLATRRSVSLNTQKTALNAVVFLYKQFLGMELGNLHFEKTTRGRRLPVVFTHEEAMAVIAQLQSHHRLAASLMYGSGGLSHVEERGAVPRFGKRVTSLQMPARSRIRGAHRRGSRGSPSYPICR